jgi:hypothetical protein
MMEVQLQSRLARTPTQQGWLGASLNDTARVDLGHVVDGSLILASRTAARKRYGSSQSR